MKTPTQRAIELSIEGGWEDFRPKIVPTDNKDSEYSTLMQRVLHREMYIHRILLDPDFWKCLGNVLQLDNYIDWAHGGWKDQHHRFIDLLHEGKTIDEALESIIGKEN